MDWQDFVYVKASKNDEPLEITDFFGRDSKKFYEAAKRVMHKQLFPFEGCYRSFERPTKIELKKTFQVPEGKSFTEMADEYYAQWYEDHPGEKEKEEKSKEEWKDEKARDFRIIYGIAKRHRYYLKWLGEDTVARCSDQWEVYKNKKRVGIIRVQ